MVQSKIQLFPIHWFGDRTAYEASILRIVTVGLNPSDREFRPDDQTEVTSTFRFPDYVGTEESLILAYNNYFNHNPYNSWFKGGFGSVLKSFDASFYSGFTNTAIHTDICSPWATIPTWSKLDNRIRDELEMEGHSLWKDLIAELKPDVILFSSSPNHEYKIDFPAVDIEWESIDVGAKRPLLIKRFYINGKVTQVYFQVQGRKPFLQTSREQKLRFKQFLKL